MASGITIRHLVFTGPSVAPAELSFNDGLNIVYGASNTGKSFTTKALNFMLAATKELPKTEEITHYDAVWLGLTLSSDRDVTLYRATKGGAFRVHDGLIKNTPSAAGAILQGKFDAKRSDNVSYFLLETLGLANKVIVKSANAEKDTLSIRLLSPYVVVSEEDIISDRSPVLYSGIPSQRTFERNLFRLLLTGNDDGAAVTVAGKKEKSVARTAKVELVDEMIAQLDEEIGEGGPTREELTEQLRKIEGSLGSLHDNLRQAQNNLDSLVTERRQLVETQRDLVSRFTELEVTLQRFGRLSEVYKSDIARLQALEEGGFILVTMAERDCPVCGAPPGVQRRNHAADEIALAHRAAAAEVRKIQIEQRELGQTITSLEAEATGLRSRSAKLSDEIDRAGKRIEDARPKEIAARHLYEELSATKARIDRAEDLYERRDRLVVRRSQIEEKASEGKADKLDVGVDSTIAYTFGEVVREVLTAWKFPQADRAQFDIETNDVTIGGKPRSANGKGVRAILHAAFNVAVLLFCRRRDLPHPGFLVLDTPLLTYREPMKSKHGELSADEEELKKTSLATHFYEHLAGLKNLAQIIIIENSDPPNGIRPLAKIETFTGVDGEGRYGLFPKLG
ncbi:hypothetical protein EOB59_33020 [Mesorhizobium sp. M7A.F.Ca.MR.176.00.0.0]|uniref:hypothetical protein n=1 Tax=Mesorhizobium sp. M7A.F.Ca.MR.176.00.0.0 TaxID=2496776 RepID=UPI000FD50ABF|nr:hypothetical protein [Mesorhizobium sp. M7A.F.Ca.MR.176.00.0.0]RUU85081.1 hypothetical protein EOB59_33020 [Mesorhizobium sp. M7A.F.Ca.MR.176.00.0.0]